jgi:hypothetical protein
MFSINFDCSDEELPSTFQNNEQQFYQLFLMPVENA